MTQRRRPSRGADGFPDEQPQRRDPFMEAALAGAAPPEDPEPGTKVSGVVMQIGSENVFVDIGSKSEALIAREELLDEQGELRVAVGDPIEATMVGRDGGSLKLSLRVGRGSADLEALRQAQQAGLPVEGRVSATNKGGFEITLAGNQRAFCPISQIDTGRVEDQEAWVGRGLEFLVQEIRGKDVVLSRRRLLEREREQQAAELKARIEPGAVFEGTVSSLQSYGAFIDLGGVEGLLHVSELAHQRVEHPSELLSVGDRLRVKVLRWDPEAGKLSLGRKQLLEDPWQTGAASLAVGQRHSGRVVRVAEFGAFVELLPGVDGLLHVSELSPGRRGADARALIEKGQELTVEITSVDLERRRIGLARVEAGDPDSALELAPGQLVKGRVERVESFGVFLRLGPGRSGLVPNAELGVARGVDLRSEFPPGRELEVEVIAIEGDRIRLSRTAAISRAERREVDRYQAEAGGGRADGFSTLGDALRKAIDSDEPKD